jgi:hypothetical protein
MEVEARLIKPPNATNDILHEFGKINEVFQEILQIAVNYTTAPDAKETADIEYLPGLQAKSRKSKRAGRGHGRLGRVGRRNVQERQGREASAVG